MVSSLGLRTLQGPHHLLDQLNERQWKLRLRQLRGEEVDDHYLLAVKHFLFEVVFVLNCEDIFHLL